MRLFVTVGLLCALLAGPTQAFAAYTPWLYKSHPAPEIDCPPAPQAPTQSTAEPADGEWLSDPASEQYKTAQVVFDYYTQVIGTSGAFASGVLANIKHESNLYPNAGEWNGRGQPDVGGAVLFEMDSDVPPANFNSADHGGGGGLFQFTPYTVFTKSAFWRKDGKAGWDPSNQVAFVWQDEFANKAVWRYASSTNPKYGAARYGKSPAFNSFMEWLTTTDAAKSAQAFQVGYERPAKYHVEREADAIQINNVFNPANIPADPAKLQANLNPATTPGVDGTDTPQQLILSNLCAKQSAGILSNAAYLSMAQQIADDESVGYSQSTRSMNPNVDCSSFVYYSLLKSGTYTEDELGHYPFNTSSMGSILIALGWKQYPYTPGVKLTGGEILLREGQHTEFVLDETHCIGAHQDFDGRDGDSNGKEVSVTDGLGSGWTSYFVPPANIAANAVAR